jgi:hypothetical protein
MPGLCYIDHHMNWDIQHIFLTPPITEVTINSVFLSPEFSIRNGDVYLLKRSRFAVEEYNAMFYAVALRWNLSGECRTE